MPTLDNAIKRPWQGKPILRDIGDMIYNRKTNCVIGITGSVGEGKSWTALNIAYQWDDDMKLENCLAYEVVDVYRKSLETVKFDGKKLTIKEWLDIFDNHEMFRSWDNFKVNSHRVTGSIGHPIIMDDASHGAYVRQFFSQDNKSLNQLLFIWRFLRCVAIFVVPEDMDYAESTIKRFLNIEIFVKKTDKVRAIAWKRFGWNKIKKEPYRRRVMGCRGRGWITISMLPEHIADEYEQMAKFYKLRALFSIVKDFPIQETTTIGKTHTIDDDIQYVKENKSKFVGKTGKIDWQLIRYHFKITQHKAQMIQKVAQKHIIEEARKDTAKYLAEVQANIDKQLQIKK